MKKKYIKPMIYIESFAINEYIANSMSCALPQHAINACVYELDGIFGTVFAKGVCKYTPDQVTGPEEDSKICYHIPTDTTRIFAS